MNRIRFVRFVRFASAAGLLLAGLLLAACSQQPATSAAEPTGSASEQASAQPDTLPTIKIIAPTEGAEVPAGTVTAKVETTDLEYTMPSNTNVAGQGHVHFTLDDRPFEMSVEPTIDLKDVGPGEHKLVAEVVQNNTESFDPPIEQEITFVVK